MKMTITEVTYDGDALLKAAFHTGETHTFDMRTEKGVDDFASLVMACGLEYVADTDDLVGATFERSRRAPPPPAAWAKTAASPF